MRSLQTLLGAVLTAGLLYLAFIVGGVVLRVVLGLLAIGAAVTAVMGLVAALRQPRGPYGR